jgi:hypothetical protein
MIKVNARRSDCIDGINERDNAMHCYSVWQRGESDLSYLQFRRSVESGFCMDGAVIVPWCGMWLAIETDGYTHS